MNELAQWIFGHSIWVFIVMVALLAGWETISPRRQLQLSTPRRWLLHGLLYFFTLTVFRLAIGIGPVAMAIQRDGWQYGLLSRPEIPLVVRILAALLILDLVRYSMHRLNHTLPWLWRLHLLHHSDRDFDFTNDLRFHPLDFGLQLGASLLTVVVLAPPPVAVALSEVLAIVVGMLAHGNIQLPSRLDEALRLVFVTPGMHQIHHSLDEREQGRNLGVVFSCWDRLMGTYLTAPARGYESMEFGVPEVDAAECVRPMHMLTAPFSSPKIEPTSQPTDLNKIVAR